MPKAIENPCKNDPRTDEEIAGYARLLGAELAAMRRELKRRGVECDLSFYTDGSVTVDCYREHREPV